MIAHSYNEIDAVAEAGCKIAAEQLELSISDVQTYYLAGGEWDATTAEELAELIAECWNEQSDAE